MKKGLLAAAASSLFLAGTASAKMYVGVGTARMPLSGSLNLFGKVGATSNRPKFVGCSNHSDVLLASASCTA